MSTLINLDICLRQGAEFRKEWKRHRTQYVFKALVNGTSDASAPTWPVQLNDTVVDNTITWVNDGEWDDNLFPNAEVWLASTAYARRARVISPIEYTDLTSYTGSFQLRPSVDSSTLRYSGQVTFGTRADGEFAMIIPTAATKLLTDEFGVFDLELITSLGEVDFVIRGKYQLIKEVTRGVIVDVPRASVGYTFQVPGVVVG